MIEPELCDECSGTRWPEEKHDDWCSLNPKNEARAVTRDPGSLGTIDEHEWVIEPATVHLHVGHRIEIVTYAGRNLAIECMTCGSVIADIDYEVNA